MWAFGILEYASHIYCVKDTINTAENIIKDSLKLLRLSNPVQQNRTDSEQVREACRDSKTFPCLIQLFWIIKIVLIC